MAFLTDIDPRAAVKGSRDPLGLVPLWSQLGRRVVGNLSTVSNSLRGFTTLLLGYHFARQVMESGRAKDEGALELFIKFEQLAGYCRQHFNRDGDFRGVERVRDALDGPSRVTLSADPRHQILASQKIYGLWGLYSVPGRESGLLAKNEAVLTAEAEEFVRTQYIRALDRKGHREGAVVADLLPGKSRVVDLEGRDRNVFEALASLLQPRIVAGEHEFYFNHLVLGGAVDRTAGLQRQLAALLPKLDAATPFDRKDLGRLRSRARQDGMDGLADALDRIEHMESLIVPAAGAFGLLLARSGRTPKEVARDISRVWGSRLHPLNAEAIDAMKDELASAQREPEAGERWVAIASELGAGRYEKALHLLMEQNAVVMEARNGSSPWVKVVDGKLEVRYLDEAGNLPGSRDLPHLWRSTYFLNSLKAVWAALQEGRQ